MEGRGDGQRQRAARPGPQRARAGEALFSRSVRQQLDSTYDGIVELPPLVLRGRLKPVEVYCIASRSRLDLRPALATI